MKARVRDARRCQDWIARAARASARRLDRRRAAGRRLAPGRRAPTRCSTTAERGRGAGAQPASGAGDRCAGHGLRTRRPRGPSRASAAGIARLRPAYPVAFGASRRRAWRAARPALTAYLQAFAANLVCGRRPPRSPSARPTGQRAAAALEPSSAAVVRARRRARSTTSARPRLRWRLIAMRHETQYTRLFRS